MTALTRPTIEAARETTADSQDEGVALTAFGDGDFWRGIVIALAFSVPAWGALAAVIWFWP